MVLFFSVFAFLLASLSAVAGDDEDQKITLHPDQIHSIAAESFGHSMVIRHPCFNSKADGLDCVWFLGERFRVVVTYTDLSGREYRVSLKDQRKRAALRIEKQMNETLKTARESGQEVVLNVPERTLTITRGDE